MSFSCLLGRYLDFEVEMFIKICALAILCLTVYAVISHISPSLSFSVKIAGAVLLFGGIIVVGESVVTQIFSLSSGESVLGEYASAVLKATGIAIIAHLCADVCKDAGHASVGNAVILAAKLEIVIICLPIIQKIISYASEIMSAR